MEKCIDTSAADGHEQRGNHQGKHCSSQEQEGCEDFCVKWSTAHGDVVTARQHDDERRGIQGHGSSAQTEEHQGAIAAQEGLNSSRLRRRFPVTGENDDRAES